jgi:DNA-binding HxlR family transcriptional regulator
METMELLTPSPANDCPMLTILDGVANKWAVLALAALRAGPLRFNQLRREMGDVSQKMLSQTLKGLERDGLVRRTAFPTVPVTVEYAMTPLGKTLVATVEVLRLWSDTHIEEVRAARSRYDSGHAG